MITERIDHLTAPPLIGRFYRVPLVDWQWCGFKGYWPVLLPAHEDARFLNFPTVHYHLDVRFLSAAQWKWAERVARNATLPDGKAVEFRGVENALQSCVIAAHRVKVSWRKRRCSAGSLTHMRTCRPMAEAFAGAQCRRDKQGWICPHKGTKLGSCQPDANGHLLCPAHGLLINAATGVVIGIRSGGA